MGLCHSHQKGGRRYYALAGFLLAFAAIYKHIGICFLLVPAVHWLLARKKGPHYGVLAGVAILVVLAYVIGMYLLWVTSTCAKASVQIQRMYGGIESRGLNYGPGEALRAVIDKYWIFFTTIACLTIGSASSCSGWSSHL